MFCGIIIRDADDDRRQEAILANYRRIAAARKGEPNPTDLRKLGLLTALSGAMPGGSGSNSSTGGGDVLDINSPPSGVAGISPKMLFLRIEPAPPKVRVETAAEGQAEPVIYAPAATSYSRVPGAQSLSFSTIIDSVITPRMMGVDPANWAALTAGHNWIGDYLAFLQSLAVPLPTVGRKPWLALKHGSDFYGAQRFGLQLEGVSYEDDWQNASGIAVAKIEVRLREYLVV